MKLQKFSLSRWMASHPWIEVTTLSDLLKRNWTPIDHGDLGLAPDQPLERYPGEGDMHYNTYFWQFYYGGISDGHLYLWERRLCPACTRMARPTPGPAAIIRLQKTRRAIIMLHSVALLVMNRHLPKGILRCNRLAPIGGIVMAPGMLLKLMAADCLEPRIRMRLCRRRFFMAFLVRKENGAYGGGSLMFLQKIRH